MLGLLWPLVLKSIPGRTASCLDCPSSSVCAFVVVATFDPSPRFCICVSLPSRSFLCCPWSCFRLWSSRWFWLVGLLCLCFFDPQLHKYSRYVGVELAGLKLCRGSWICIGPGYIKILTQLMYSSRPTHGDTCSRSVQRFAETCYAPIATEVLIGSTSQVSSKHTNS